MYWVHWKQRVLKVLKVWESLKSCQRALRCVCGLPNNFGGEFSKVGDQVISQHNHFLFHFVKEHLVGGRRSSDQEHFGQKSSDYNTLNGLTCLVTSQHSKDGRWGTRKLSRMVGSLPLGHLDHRQVGETSKDQSDQTSTWLDSLTPF